MSAKTSPLELFVHSIQAKRATILTERHDHDLQQREEKRIHAGRPHPQPFLPLLSAESVAAIVASCTLTGQRRYTHFTMHPEFTAALYR
ncbi:hypothetical protein CGMCC3_g7769 [Colletotrichum fructicola]|nr:uncharacterized protein CGMCC3_g7769 [Colletotrichum fructicola]KAE9576241.1 hypothetical protein CGMCC3_g7769 [Colletotrichum fructicola]